MRRVRWESISSELLMCGGGGRGILIMFDCFFMSVVVIVWGSVGMFIV